ncbi:hypothetical protein C6P46_002532 [Rhodotorula mucilaginosa]|uniref:DUF4042 domain-containing protein n=1 Tax=Rhodotorula mucilaginosa TaxID=5537 RepID=A0A9P7B9Z2_RHOMI|nr:hypothetical protein C6P46_002532 [Rhodotorula mucilaginosa]
MQALESARRAIEQLGLEVPVDAESQHAVRPDSDALHLWLECLQLPEQSEEDLVLILRAIRDAEAIVVAVARLLLPDNPLPVRGQAAGCLLQYISICKADARQRTAPVLLASISKALGPIKFQLATGGQRLYRFVSTCLRILAVLVSQTLLNDEDQCRTLVGVVAAWVFTGTQARSGLASPAPNKSRIPSTTPGASQLSFGVMSAFAQQSPQKRTPRPRQNSDASTSARSISLASSRGGSENRLSDSESETESEAGQPRRAAQLRLDALGVLQTVAATDARVLHKHWHLFLADSPFLRNRPTFFSLIESDPSRTVRTRAALTLKCMLEGSEAFLAIAEERTTKAAFTSLSRQVGETVVEMHLSLAHCLEQTPTAVGQIEAHLAQLSLAETLGRVAPYGRLQRPLAWALSKAIIPLLHQDGKLSRLPACLIRNLPADGHFVYADSRLLQGAIFALCAITHRQIATSSKALFEWQALLSAATTLLHTDKEPRAWQLLSAIAESQTPADWSSTLDRAAAKFGTVAAETQLAQVSLATSLLRLEPPAARQNVLLIVSQALQSPYTIVVAAACAALSFLQACDHSSIDPWTTAIALVASAGSNDITRAAVRAIGVMAKDHQRDGQLPEQVHEAAILALLALLDCDTPSESATFDATADAGETTWSLANLCDLLPSRATLSYSNTRLLDLASLLAVRDEDDEQIASNAFRIMTSVYKCRAATVAAEATSTSAALCIGMKHSAAKVRWNACIAASAFLGATSVGEPTSSTQSVIKTLIDRLAQDSSYKVRIHAANAVIAVSSTTSYEQELVQVCRTALEQLEAQLSTYEIANRERAHAEVLVKRVKTLLSRRPN